MPEIAGRFDPYVPRVASEWDAVAPGAHWRQIDGSLAFVDISGFTNLSERLARKGKVGAEELTAVLNRVFGRMLDAAYLRGGSLLKFGGDALLLMFDSEDHVIQGAAAIVEMRSILREASKEPTSVGRINLKMSSGLHCGPIDFFLVGDSHRELIITGPTSSGATEMEHAADASEILVTGAVRDRLPRGFVGDAKDNGWLLKKQKINHPAPGLVTREVDQRELAAFVPRALREQLESGVSDSEHRLATIGFIKFEGVDAMLEAAGPELIATELNRLVKTIQRAADAEEVTFLGTDIDVDGGKVILATGVPSSRHDDEGKMLRTARRILESRCALSVRIGVNRGHVFSGDVGTEFRRTYTVMGDTVNLAARLMAAAHPWSLYSSPAVLDLSSTLFRTETLEPFSVKGKEQPVQAYEVFEETGTRPPEFVQELPFHGRSFELDMVVEVVTTCARQGRGGIMTISGDTGIGKTRLIAEVLARCTGMDTLMIQAEPNGSENPYWALRDPMRRVLGVERGGQEDMVRSLQAAIKKKAPDLVGAVPLLGDVLHIEVPDTKETADIDPQFRPARTADAVIELFDALFRAPLAVLADDSHWLDPASLALLERLGTAAETRPWTVILTARPTESGFEPLGDGIKLEPLPDEDIRSITIEATAAAPLRPHELDLIVERASGNPLFLSEILKVVRESGSADELPDSLDAVVSTQIDTLPPLSRQLLRYCAVLGSSFRRVVLELLLEPEGIVLDDATLKDLEVFIEPEGDRFRFRHNVVHDVAYEGLSYRRRRELHARAGSVVEQMAGDDPESVAEALANHYSHSGDWEKVWRYARVAAEKARSAYANTEAAAHYRRAIDAASHLEIAERTELADAWTRFGEVQELAGLFEAAREAYSRGLRETESDQGRMVDTFLLRAGTWLSSGNLAQAKRNVSLARNRLSLEPGPQRTRALARLDAFEASIHAASGSADQAFTLATAAIAEARRAGEEEALARAIIALDGANFMLGRNEPRMGEQAIEILERLGQVERSVGVMNNLGAFAYWEGNWNEAVDWYGRAIDAALRSGNVLHAADTRVNLAELLINQRNLDRARPLLDEAERIYVSSRVLKGMPFLRMQQGRLLIASGEFEEAIAVLEPLFVDQMTSRDASEDPEIAVHLAEALVGAHRAREALDALERFEALAPDEAAGMTAIIERVRGLAFSSLGDGDEASGRFALALEAATEEGDEFAELLIREVRSRALDEPSDHADRIAKIARGLGVSLETAGV